MTGKISGVPIHRGERQGKADLLAVALDAFELILGMDILKTVKTTIFPHLSGLLTMDEEHPCFVTGISKKKKRARR